MAFSVNQQGEHMVYEEGNMCLEWDRKAAQRIYLALGGFLGLAISSSSGTPARARKSASKGARRTTTARST